MRKTKKDGHVVLGCPLSEQKEEEMLGPRKAEHSEWEPEWFLPPHLTDFQKAATSSVLGDAHPHGPSTQVTQLSYSPQL